MPLRRARERQLNLVGRTIGIRMRPNTVRKSSIERIPAEKLGDNELVERYLAGDSRRFQE